MPAFTAKSLRLKLLFWIIILLVPILILITFRSYFAVNLFTNKANDRALFSMALAIANQIKENAGSITIDLAAGASTSSHDSHKETLYFQILDHKHQFVAGNKTLVKPKIYPTKGRHLYYNATVNSQKLRILALDLPPNSEQKQNSMTVLVGEETTHRSESLQEIIIFFIITQFFLILITFFSISYAIKRGLRPFVKLSQRIESRQPWDTSPIEHTNIPVEIKPLINAMNGLLKKVKNSLQVKQQFIANAAHQIKTPISGLKLQAENALNSNDPEYIQHALRQICFVSNNLARLTQQLLALTRTELTDEEINAFSPTDLVSITQDAVTDWVPDAIKKQIDLGVSFNADRVFIRANAILIRELLNNLIDNAIRYNPPRTSINVSVSYEPETIILSVKDDGVGIPEADQKKIFQRFYRPITTIESGCGLGLSIVEEIAKLHDAYIELTYSEPKSKTGTLIQVIFKHYAAVASNKK